MKHKPTGTNEYSQFALQDEEPYTGIQSRLVHHIKTYFIMNLKVIEISDKET